MTREDQQKLFDSFLDWYSDENSIISLKKRFMFSWYCKDPIFGDELCFARYNGKDVMACPTSEKSCDVYVPNGTDSIYDVIHIDDISDPSVNLECRMIDIVPYFNIAFMESLVDSGYNFFSVFGYSGIPAQFVKASEEELTFKKPNEEEITINIRDVCGRLKDAYLRESDHNRRYRWYSGLEPVHDTFFTLSTILRPIIEVDKSEVVRVDNTLISPTYADKKQVYKFDGHLVTLSSITPEAIYAYPIFNQETVFGKVCPIEIAQKDADKILCVASEGQRIQQLKRKSVELFKSTDNVYVFEWNDGYSCLVPICSEEHFSINNEGYAYIPKRTPRTLKRVFRRCDINLFGQQKELENIERYSCLLNVLIDTPIFKEESKKDE